MSEAWQDSLQHYEEEIAEDLGLVEEDRQYIWDNLEEFCKESDKEVLENYIAEEEQEEKEEEFTKEEEEEKE